MAASPPRSPVAVAPSGSRPRTVIRMQDGQLAFRKSEDAAVRRNQAATWIKSMVEGLEMASEVSDEEFCSYLRSGFILCNLINKIRPGAVPKVVPNIVSPVVPQGQTLSAYQYFENIRNFLVAVAGLKLPTFEASDLEQGSLPSSVAKVVNCILGLKAYHEWMLSGGNGTRKYAGISRSPMVPKNAGTFPQLSSSNNMKNFDYLQAPSSVTNKNNCNQTDVDDVHKENIDANGVLSRQTSELDGEIAIWTNEGPCRTLLKENQHLVGLQISREQYEELMNHAIVLSKHAKDLRYELQIIKKEQLSFQKGVPKTCQLMIDDWAMEYKEKCRRQEEENKKLLNELLDLKGKIRVMCRVRPLLASKKDDYNAVDIMENDGSILLNNTITKDPAREFKFNKVFGPYATQDVVYKETQPLIRSVMDGYNICIFAYGQTGSGKTHTMSGPGNATENNLGVNYRALRDLFEISTNRENVMTYSINVQMIEIYNETVRDLLGPETSTQKLDVRMDAHDGLNVPGAKLIPVNCPLDVLKLMEHGQSNRAVSSTFLNDRSSRSHSVLMVHVDAIDSTNGSRTHSCLNLIDLAGSERIQKSGVQGDRLKESVSINKSLSALGDVIAALAQKSAHVPYRNSKLTQVLQGSLGGQAKMMMFVHISPELEFYSETLSTLKFAEKVSSVELGTVRSNKESGEILKLREQIAFLKRELVRKDEALEKKESELHAARFGTGRFTAVEESTVYAPPLENAEIASTEDFSFSSESTQSQSNFDKSSKPNNMAPLKTPESKFTHRFVPVGDASSCKASEKTKGALRSSIAANTKTSQKKTFFKKFVNIAEKRMPSDGVASPPERQPRKSAILKKAEARHSATTARATSSPVKENRRASMYGMNVPSAFPEAPGHRLNCNRRASIGGLPRPNISVPVSSPATQLRRTSLGKISNEGKPNAAAQGKKNVQKGLFKWPS